MTGPLRYVGAPVAVPEDLAYRAYVLELLSQNISQGEVDALLGAGFAPYVQKSYVDTRDALNATKAFIDAGDATKLKLAQREVSNGIAGLGSTGRVAVSHLNVASTQRFPRPFLSPTAYHGSPVTASATEVLLYPPVTVADPGFAYKLLVTGLVDAAATVDGSFPVIRVRQGSASGQLVASGAGLAQFYAGGTTTPFTTVGGQSYVIPPWAVTLDVVGLGGGGGGAGGNNFNGDGRGGNPGSVATATLTRGVQIPLGTNVLNITVGTGGAAGDNSNGSGGAGGGTSITGAGWAGITGNGGSGGVGINPGFGHEYYGDGPGTITFNGRTYQGGGTQTELNQPGIAPGGAGAGGDGQAFDSDPGGAGTAGAAWVTAYSSPNVPSGPVPIVPTPHNAQTVITGATTLHVMLVRSGSGSVTASTLRPKLWVCPVPA